MLDAVLSITILAAILLVAGAYFMWRRTGNVKNALLMVVLAACLGIGSGGCTCCLRSYAALISFQGS